MSHTCWVQRGPAAADLLVRTETLSLAGLSLEEAWRLAQASGAPSRALLAVHQGEPVLVWYTTVPFSWDAHEPSLAGMQGS